LEAVAAIDPHGMGADEFEVADDVEAAFLDELPASSVLGELVAFDGLSRRITQLESGLTAARRGPNQNGKLLIPTWSRPPATYTGIPDRSHVYSALWET
jgi:hypothetical protein